MLKSPTLRDPLCRSLLSTLFSACATRSISPSSSPKFLGAPQVPLPCLLPLAIQPLLLLPPGLHVLWPLISPLRPIPSSCRVGLCVNTSAGIIRCWVCCSASTTVSGMQSMFNERGSLWILNLILPATNTALSSGSIYSRNWTSSSATSSKLSCTFWKAWGVLNYQLSRKWRNKTLDL